MSTLWPAQSTPRAYKPHIRYERGVWPVRIRGRRPCDNANIVVFCRGDRFPKLSLEAACRELSERAATWP